MGPAKSVLISFMQDSLFQYFCVNMNWNGNDMALKCRETSVDCPHQAIG